MFNPGDIVVAIATDNFYPDEMSIGSEWVVIKHNPINDNYRGGTITLQSPDPSNRWGINATVTPYADKFALKSHINRLNDLDFTLEELETAEHIMETC